MFPAGELGLALDKGEVDAVADSEPIGRVLLMADGKVRNIADPVRGGFTIAKDAYCCAVLVNGKVPGSKGTRKLRRRRRAPC